MIGASETLIQDSNGPSNQIPMWFKEVDASLFCSEWAQWIRNRGPKSLCRVAFPHLMREPNYYHHKFTIHNSTFLFLMLYLLLATLNVCYQHLASNVVLGIDHIRSGHHHLKQRQKWQYYCNIIRFGHVILNLYHIFIIMTYVYIKCIHTLGSRNIANNEYGYL